MIIIEEHFDGVLLFRPFHSNFEWPCLTFKKFPTCCGAGKFGDRFIPDAPLNLNLSPACFVHDFMWTHCPKSWKWFCKSNLIFYKNITRINISKSNSIFEMATRQFVLSKYAAAVCTVGAFHFWRIKQ